jgi:TonB family protein
MLLNRQLFKLSIKILSLDIKNRLLCARGNMIKSIKLIRLAILGALLLNLSGNATGQTNGIDADYQYRNTEGGLKRLIGDMIKTRRAQESAKFQKLVDSLILPNYAEWFISTFGSDIGGQYAAEYRPDGKILQLALGNVFDEAISSKLTSLRVDKLDDECDSTVEADQYPILISRINKEPIYQVYFSDPGSGNSFRLWAFTYIDGAFRFLQNLKVKEPHWNLDSRFVRLGENVLASKIVHREKMIYPEEAKTKHIQGTVKLWAIINKEGSVREVRIREGICLLSKAAIEAVKKWQYTPTIVSGNAVEVVANVEVIFQLRY